MNPFKVLFHAFSEIILLNVLFLMTILLGVFIPAGAGMKAMFYVSDKIIDRERATYVAKEYWTALKDGFLRSTMIWFMFVATGFLLYIAHKMGTEQGHVLLMSTSLVAMVLLGLYAVYVFAVMAQFKSDSIGRLFKNAFLLMASSPWALFKVAGSVVFTILLFYLFSGTVLFSIGLFTVLTTLHLNKLFMPHKQQLTNTRNDSHA